MVHPVQGVVVAPDITTDQRLQASIAASSGLAPNTATADLDRALSGMAPEAEAVEYRLGLDAVERSFGADSPLARKMRSSRAVSAAIRASTIPSDKESFRQDVRRHLMRAFGHDEAFRRALQQGTLVIQTTDETPELNFQPLIDYSVYRDGVEKGAGQFSPAGFNDRLYQQLGQTRNQTRGHLGLRQFYAWWPQ
ncbi:hypothetical protein PE067_18675 [Paracoccus sp. DMF-8]|uniref:hypothetical protein n=1 Tax=Paracoccus sp. DMF-8 TaxID=3019445 RepID=UPI0023E3EAB5|nr:hypothetical protein [Paracoccus sp. DMF-8]MDF3607973.1 hypothetical protein [Paracoccus sp. DMF-8]